MKKLFSIAALATTTLVAAQSSAFAGGVGNNSIGPSVVFGGGNTSIGADAKFGIANNLSVRPFAVFGSNTTNLGASLTYDFDLRNSANTITPFIGAGVDFTTSGPSNTVGFVQAGADIHLSRQFALLAAVDVPFTGNGAVTTGKAGLQLKF
jgi:outer membrane protein W